MNYHTHLELLANSLDFFLEFLSLNSASWCGVSGVEVHDERFLVLGTRESLAVLIYEGEIGRSLANLEVQGGTLSGGGDGGEGTGGGAEGGSDESLHDCCCGWTR